MPLGGRYLKPVVEFGKKVVFRHTPLGRPTYPYPCVEPIELATLIIEIERLRGTVGVILEIGVARGMTTRFMAEQIRASGSSDRIIAIDTFNSFVDSDIEFEVSQRGKNQIDLAGFAYNDFEVWKRNFKEFPFVEPMQADCSTVDYMALGPVKLAFLDVDLYLPIKKTLPKLYEALTPGGVILVDDVAPHKIYDGAYQAFQEFCAEASITPEHVGNKCGVIRK